MGAKCKYCGAAFLRKDGDFVLVWACESTYRPDTFRDHQSTTCRINQLTAENAFLREGLRDLAEADNPNR